MRRKFKTRTVTLRMPWTGRDVPTNRQVASWLHRFLEDPRRGLLPDPGHGAGPRVSYRLEAVEITLGLDFSGSRTPSELLRRVIHTYRGQAAPQSAPASRPARQPVPAPAPIPARRPPSTSSHVYPADGRRIEIAVEDVKAELAKVGYPSVAVQPTSRYFRVGNRVIREEGGQVIQVFEAP